MKRQQDWEDFCDNAPDPQRQQKPQVQQKAQVQQLQQVQTIEKTSKYWKGHILLSTLAIFVSFALIIVAAGSDNPAFGAISVLLLMFSILWTIVSRVGKWWYHG